MLSNSCAAWLTSASAKYSNAASVVSFFFLRPSRKSGFSNFCLQNISNSFSVIIFFPSYAAFLYLPPSTTGLLSSSNLPTTRIAVFAVTLLISLPSFCLIKYSSFSLVIFSNTPETHMPRPPSGPAFASSEFSALNSLYSALLGFSASCFLYFRLWSSLNLAH